MLKLFEDTNEFRLLALGSYYCGDTEAWRG